MSENMYQPIEPFNCRNGFSTTVVVVVVVAVKVKAAQSRETVGKSARLF